MLVQAIENVLSQDYEKFEHIIVDGDSTNGTLEILASYHHLRVLTGKDKSMYM
jgi:glycosyltransferase involved in cell wall biosynthesis